VLIPEQPASGEVGEKICGGLLKDSVWKREGVVGRSPLPQRLGEKVKI